jgi:hypothetical protein
MAEGPIQSVAYKRLYGGQYVQAGHYMAILAVLYESCALLGRMFKDDVPSLAQLLHVKPGDVGESVRLWKEMADERLGRYRLIYGDDLSSLFFLVLATEYASVGSVFPHGHVGSFDDMERIKRAAQSKVSLDNENLWRRLEMTLSEGTGFGLLYPEKTLDLISWRFKPRDPEEWKYFRSAGIDVPDGPPVTSLQEMETMLLDLVREYVQQFRPEMAYPRPSRDGQQDRGTVASCSPIPLLYEDWKH